MHNIIVFESKQWGNIRTLIEEGNQAPWFWAIDICRALDIDPTATRRLDKDERVTVRLTHTSSDGTFQERKLACVSESGLYALRNVLRQACEHHALDAIPGSAEGGRRK